MTPAAQADAIVTGSTGFVGRALLARLGARARGLRLSGEGWREGIGRADFRGATVFHLAARVHRPGEDDEAAYARDNVEKTRALAQAATEGGARRFVFLSSIKVNGEETGARPFAAGDAPAPADAYARSKLAAEEALRSLAGRGGLEVTIVRSPLVVGAGAAGHLRALLALVDTPWPLPFAGIANRRTLIEAGDLAELLERASGNGDAAGRTLLAGDPSALSTPAIVGILRRALARPVRLFACPGGLLELAAGLAGQGGRMRRLTRSLEVDVAETTAMLGWTPRTGAAAGLEALALAWRAERAP